MVVVAASENQVAVRGRDWDSSQPTAQRSAKGEDELPHSKHIHLIRAKGTSEGSPLSNAREVLPLAAPPSARLRRSVLVVVAARAGGNKYGWDLDSWLRMIRREGS